MPNTQISKFNERTKSSSLVSLKKHRYIIIDIHCEQIFTFRGKMCDFKPCCSFSTLQKPLYHQAVKVNGAYNVLK
jgi:hypothetical protein